MREIIKYECEICRKLHDSKDEALDCEDQGKESPLAKEGDTVEYLDEWNGGYGPIWDTYALFCVSDTGHSINYSLGTEYRYAEFSGCSLDVEVEGNEEFIRLCRVKN